jgi:F-type H+-transporting ATPase subunit delta
MRGGTAAYRYAKALFSLAQDDHKQTEVRDEIERLNGLFQGSDELREALLTPRFPAAQRKSALAAIAERANVSLLVRNFISYLIDQRRLIDFGGIVSAYAELADAAAGLITAEVVAASPLDDRRKDRLRRALSERTGHEVRLEIEVDPTLIGGAIAKVGDLVFDGSLRTQLRMLRSNLSGTSTGSSVSGTSAGPSATKGS